MRTRPTFSSRSRTCPRTRTNTTASPPHEIAWKAWRFREDPGLSTPRNRLESVAIPRGPRLFPRQFVRRGAQHAGERAVDPGRSGAMGQHEGAAAAHVDGAPL